MFLPKSGLVTYLVKLTLSKGFLAFCLIFVFYACYLSTTTYDYLPYDSGTYWELGNTFFKDGQFSLLNYENVFRGYLFPLINYPINKLWYVTGIELFAIIKVIGALLAALFFGVAIPQLVQKAGMISEISVLQRCIFAFLGFLFWRDYFSFTLSDFPALLALTFSVFILVSKPKTRLIIIAGVLFGTTVNFRPTYTICFLLIPAFFLFDTEPKYYSAAGQKLLFFLLGFLIISLPQIVINLNLAKTYSPLVQASYGNQKKNLYLIQLEWGLVIQKYESSLGIGYPFARMAFIDSEGVELVRDNNLSIDFSMIDENLNNIYGISNDHQKSFQNLGQYFNLVINNPVEFIRIYLKHIFNGFDIQYPTPYIKDVFKVNIGLVVANFTILYIAFLIFCFRIFPKLNAMQVIVLLLFSAPCLLAIPTAIEVRYFLPFHIMAYAAVAFGFPRNWMHAISFRNKALILAGYFVFIGFCLFTSNQMQQTLMHMPRHLF